MAEEKHKVSVKQEKGDEDFVRIYGAKWVAKCSCGWEAARSSREKAQRSQVEHESQ